MIMNLKNGSINDIRNFPGLAIVGEIGPELIFPLEDIDLASVLDDLKRILNGEMRTGE